MKDTWYLICLLASWLFYILFQGWYYHFFQNKRTVLHSVEQMNDFYNPYNRSLNNAVNRLWTESDIPFPMTVEERPSWWRPVDDIKVFNRETTYRLGKCDEIKITKTKNYVY